MCMPASRAQQAAPTISLNAQPIKVRYTNWRGETAVRSIVPQRIYWGKTEWHPHEQWLLEVLEVDRNLTRIFALADITEWFVA